MNFYWILTYALLDNLLWQRKKLKQKKLTIPIMLLK